MNDNGLPVAHYEAFVRARCAIGHEWVTKMHKVTVDKPGRRRPRALQIYLERETCPQCRKSWTGYSETRHG